jgi:single-stranded-DNA-specific exonuclease
MIKRRSFRSNNNLNDLHPVLARLYQARGVQAIDELEYVLARLYPYEQLLNINSAAQLLAEAIYQQQHIMIIGDFDADGATSTALAVRVLLACGAKKVSFVVPNRFEYGYGLTPAIVDLAVTKTAGQQPNLIMTVDNGISSIEGVERANTLGIQVIITDHHLAADILPNAAAIVNPNQPGDVFPSKSLAGVGVCFYVLLALRAVLRQADWFKQQNIMEPKLADYLDIVALGTVADVVSLDHNNRILVHQGLQRIRAGHCVPGIKALLEISGRDLKKISALDLGFAVAPRLNAAGRLDDMSLGINCLLADDPTMAKELAQQLDTLNQERRGIEQDMKLQALKALEKMQLDAKNLPLGITLFNPEWHQGVIGILAARIKDQHHRPTIIFAEGGTNELKGSARSVRGVHIRDVLDAIAKQHPTLITKFGGHAMAAGLSLSPDKLTLFTQAFNTEVAKHLTLADVHGEILSDGELSEAELCMATANLLTSAGPWGQAFPEPIFDGIFEIVEQRIVGQKHLRLSVRYPEGKRVYSGIKFNIDLEQWPNHRCTQVHLAYKLDINEFNEVKSVQLRIEYLEALR